MSWLSEAWKKADKQLGVGDIASTISTGGLSAMNKAAGKALKRGIAGKDKKVNPAQQFDSSGAEAVFAQSKEANEAARQKLQEQQAALAGREAVQLDPALMARLQASAAGEGPSQAQNQLQAATDQNLRNALAMARSGRGNPALAMQAANRQRGMLSQQAANQSGQLRAAEMAQAQNQLLQANQINMAAQQQFQRDLDAQNQYYNQQLQGLNRDDRMAQLELEAMRRGDYQAAEAARVARERAAAEKQQGLFRTIGSTGGAIIGGIYGGPTGATAGAQIGGAIGNQV